MCVCTFVFSPRIIFSVCYHCLNLAVHMFDCVQTHSKSPVEQLCPPCNQTHTHKQGGAKEHNKCKKKGKAISLSQISFFQSSKRNTHPHARSHKHRRTLRLRLCHKETDLPGLTQVQMSQCGWISFGIVSAPSFDKEVFLSPRRDMTVSSGLGSPRQHSGLAGKTRVNPFSRHAYTNEDRK